MLDYVKHSYMLKTYFSMLNLMSFCLNRYMDRRKKIGVLYPPLCLNDIVLSGTPHAYKQPNECKLRNKRKKKHKRKDRYHLMYAMKPHMH
jgi:hypothetical protein